jgi:hypothetical protein
MSDRTSTLQKIREYYSEYEAAIFNCEIGSPRYNRPSGLKVGVVTFLIIIDLNQS